MDKLRIDKETLILLYRKHRDYIIPFAMIAVGFLLLVKVTIPQIGDLSIKQQEAKAERDKLNVLKNNLTVLNSVSDDSLDRYLTVVSAALPLEKNFAETINAVTAAANRSGVLLGDYEFQVGDLSKTAVVGKNIPSLQLSLSVDGGTSGAVKFMTELRKSLPLSEISKVEVTSSKSTISVVFYYKQPAGGIDISTPLSSLSKNDLDVLNQLLSWNSAAGAIKIPAASSSAKPSSPF